MIIGTGKDHNLTVIYLYVKLTRSRLAMANLIVIVIILGRMNLS